MKKVFVKALSVLLTLTMLFGLTSSWATFSTAATLVLGDADGNGDITTTDARLALQFAVGKGVSIDEDAADVDGNEQITTTDARLILQYAVGKITAFPRVIEEPEPEPEPEPEELDENLVLAYNFTNNDPGSAAGTIKLYATDPSSLGAYTIHYADNSGPLADYEEIATFYVTSIGESSASSYNAFIAQNALPPEATRIVAVKDGNVVAAYRFPQSKVADYGEPLYAFTALSDIHLQNNQSDTDGYMDFQKALSILDSYDIDFGCITGDLGMNSTNSELQLYKQVIESYAKVPFYPVKGNHDKKHSLETWRSYTGRELNYTVEVDGDVFVFMSFDQINDVSSDAAVNYAQTLSWLETTLAEAAGSRVFMFMHLPFPGYAGLRPNTYYGFTSNSTEPAQILQMIKDCDNVIVFSGHTHFNFASQVRYPNITVRPITDSNSYTVHIPSLAYPRDADSVQKSLESEGYIVEVYQDIVLLKGFDFISKKFVPMGTFGLGVGSGQSMPSTLSLAEGQTKTLQLRGNYNQVAWSTSDPSVATVENGVVTAVKAGTATITATADGVAHTCVVTVTEPVPVTLSVGDSTIKMQETLTVKISGTVFDPDSITWTSDNTAVATVKNGVITGVNAGTANIKVTVDGKEYSIKITVVNPLGGLAGSGTQSDPYIIATAQDFVTFQDVSINGNTFSGKYFLQTADINLTNYSSYQPYNNATRTAVFAGFYNGNGHTLTATVPKGISNFTAAFFWEITGTVVNCGFNVTHGGASETTYGVCRKFTGGRMINCYMTGSLVGVNDYTTVIGGTSSGAVINNMYVDVTVTGGGSAVSGVTIKGSGNNVTNCYYTDNGLKSNYAGEIKVTKQELQTTVADSLNNNLPAVATATGISLQVLCSWAKVEGGNPVLISK